MLRYWLKTSGQAFFLTRLHSKCFGLLPYTIRLLCNLGKASAEGKMPDTLLDPIQKSALPI
jgi:hypothetical protein